MDPIGFTAEHYDAFGRWRQTDNNYPIDATGTIVRANAADGDVSLDGLAGPKGLETYLATNPDLPGCMMRYWAYYAYGTSSWDEDACTLDAVNQEAKAGQYGLRSALMAIIHAPHFTSRATDP